MKQVIYITGNKVWFNGVVNNWQGNGLVELFRAHKHNMDFSEVRVIVGNQLCYLTAFPWRKELLDREVVELEARKYLPIPIGDENFDWKVVEINNEKWIQAAAVEKNFLELVSRAVKTSGLRVSTIIPIGFLLGQKSVGRGGPVLIKWNGMEKLSILAVRGLVDSVFANMTDEKIRSYAKNKWRYPANLELLDLADSNYNLNEEVFKEKNGKTDAQTMNIPIFRSIEFPEAKVSRRGWLSKIFD